MTKTQLPTIDFTLIGNVFPEILASTLPQIKSSNDPVELAINQIMNAYHCDRATAQTRLNKEFWNPMLNPQLQRAA